MAISDTIQSMQDNLRNAYDSVENKGGKLVSKNLFNLEHWTNHTRFNASTRKLVEGFGLSTNTPLEVEENDVIHFYYPVAYVNYSIYKYDKDFNYLGNNYYQYRSGEVIYNITADVKYIYLNVGQDNKEFSKNELLRNKFIITKNESVEPYEPYEIPKNLSNLSTAIESIQPQFEYDLSLSGNGFRAKIEKINYFAVPSNLGVTYLFEGMSNLKKIDNFEYDGQPTSIQYVLNNCNNIESLPSINLSKTTSLMYAFNACRKIKECEMLNTLGNDKITSLQSTFNGCTLLDNIPKLSASKLVNTSTTFVGCTSLSNFGGLDELGKGYVQKTANYNNYKLDLSTCTALTNDSLMNVINNLYDLNLTYKVTDGGTLYTQSLVLGATNLAKLTDDEIAIATQKGWTVS